MLSRTDDGLNIAVVLSVGRERNAAVYLPWQHGIRRVMMGSEPWPASGSMNFHSQSCSSAKAYFVTASGAACLLCPQLAAYGTL